MISRLRGRLLECDVTGVLVDIQGVGFAVAVPLSTFDHLPKVGEEVVLHTWLAVREDSLTLYGFSSVAERSLFLLLLTVTGIGPRLALNILSCLPVSSFCAAVAEGDIKTLTRISGIGKRSAERLVVELRDRVAEIAPSLAGRAAPAVSREAVDAIAALETLGFKSEAARQAVQAVCEQSKDTQASAESLIRKALALLNS
ncbi:MAG: Holliday junction branch migration protein RuvA [Lentisphaerae bacterium]|nr:Holliday junction branch migration protein RuvA [Lentisphaerota bacterium]